FRYDLPGFVNDDEAVFLAGLCIVLGVIFIQISLAIPHFSQLAAPVAAIAIVVTVLLHLRLALLISVVLSIVGGILSHFNFDLMFVIFCSCAAGMLAAQRVRTRGDITRAGFHVAWVTILALYGMDIFHGRGAARLLVDVKWGVLSGLFSALIPLALLPILESFFSRVTAITLLEVGDFNRPLLRRLMLE